MEATIRWTLFIIGFIVVALAFQAVWPLAATPEGTPGPSIAVAVNPWPAALAAAAALILAGIVGIGIARRATGLSGLAVIGAAIGWSALALAGVGPEVLASNPARMAIDGVVWTVAVLMMSYGSLVFGRPVADVFPVEEGCPPDPLTSRDAMRVLIAGVAALPVAWFVAASAARGQVVAAAVAGGVAAGLVARLWAPHVQPMLAPAGVVLAGTLALWVSGMMLPDDVFAAWTRGDVPRLVLPSPVDWAAGALFGVPIGYRMAKSFLSHEGEPIQA